MELESYFISRFATKKIGDDGAFIDGFVYSKDAFFENVHFKKEWLSYKQAAYKAMVVNISDAVAMNAKPKYALLAVSMPKEISPKEMEEIAQGFKEAAKKYGVEIIGGDTIAGDKLDITVTIVSKAKKPLFRKGLKQGDLVAYTGELGRSKKELQKLLRGGKIHKKSKFLTIDLRARFIEQTRRYLHAGMDISDGLFSDLEKLATINKKGFVFKKKIDKKIGCSGEEYEILVGFDTRYKQAILRRAKQTRTPLTIFAKARRTNYKNICKGHHFG